MTPAISIALLLLSATVIKSLEVQPKEEEDFAPQSELAARRRVQHRREEILQNGAFPGSCRACKAAVSKVKQELGKDRSKEKIQRLLDKACNKVKNGLLKSACKKLLKLIKNKLIDAIANGGTARKICATLKLCKKNKPIYKQQI